MKRKSIPAALAALCLAVVLLPKLVINANAAGEAGIDEQVSTWEELQDSLEHFEGEFMDSALIASLSAPRFEGVSLVLSGQIGMHFYMTIPEGYDVHEMAFTVGDRTATAAGVKKGDMYQFTCYVNSIEMAETIRAEYTYEESGQTKTCSRETSVKEYLETIIHGTDNPEFVKATPLAKAIYNYGHYAMLAVPGGSKHPLMPDTYTSEANLIETLEGYPVTTDLDKTVIKSGGYSINLESETMIFIYLQTDAVLTKQNVSVTAEKGVSFAYEVEKANAAYYRVKITGIAAHELGAMFTVTTGNSTFTASALSYVQSTLADASAAEAAKQAAAALYEYYHQTIEYRKQ